MNASKLRQADAREKDEIRNALYAVLESRSEVSFAYVHGSFTGQKGFHDIDLALYIRDLPASVLEYELTLETEMMEKARCCEIDVRILSRAPLSFRYHVIKEGIPLLVRNDDRRTEFIEETLERYFDFEPFKREYLRETFSA